MHMKRSVIFKSVLLLLTVIVGGWLAYSYRTSSEIIKSPVSFEGIKTIVKNVQPLEPGSLIGKDTLTMSYDLRGVCLLDGPASAVDLVAADGKIYSISLSRYGTNCLDGTQTVKISFKDFAIDQPVDTMRSIEIQFWYPTSYNIEIEKITAGPPILEFSTKDTQDFLMGRLASQRKPPKTSRNPPKLPPPPIKPPPPQVILPPIQPPPPALPPPPPAAISTSTPAAPPPVFGASFWPIRSVSSMKETKDKICGQDSLAFINAWIGKAIELGANYVAVETPYDDPACGSSVAYTKAWVDAIHARELNVWHRHMPLAFEGIYDMQKDSARNYLELIANYIKTNPTLFRAGDIFTPVPEPQNGGIAGVTYCPQNICIFADAAVFNKWLRDAITTSEAAFASIGLGGKMRIGYYGFDGFVAWGDNNPDWNGILEDATVSAMGNITIDHYPEIVGDTMENDLNELQEKYSTTPIIIGEWGTITGGDTPSQVQKSMQAARRKNVVGFNYWHMGMGGNEALINDDFSSNTAFAAVKAFFMGQ